MCQLPRDSHGRDQATKHNSLLTISSKLLIKPPPLNTSYRRGTWMSHRTLCEMSLLLTTHLASLSHSCRLLQVS